MWSRRRFFLLPLAGLASAASLPASPQAPPADSPRFAVRLVEGFPYPPALLRRVSGRSWPSAAAALRAARSRRFPCLVFRTTHLEKNKTDPVACQSGH